MNNYTQYINALRACAKEHGSDVTPFAHIRVSDLCRDVADLLEKLEQEHCEDAVSRKAMLDCFKKCQPYMATRMDKYEQELKDLPSIQPKPKTGWIPLKTRPMTEEETEHYFEYTDMRIDDTYTILDCPLPDDGQEVLVSWGGNVVNDVFIQDSEGCYFEGVDIDEVDAWMPLPKAYVPDTNIGNMSEIPTDSEKEKRNE